MLQQKIGPEWTINTHSNSSLTTLASSYSGLRSKTPLSIYFNKIFCLAFWSYVPFHSIHLRRFVPSFPESKITSTVIYSQPSMFFHFRFIQPKHLHCWIRETTHHQLPRITQAGSVDLSVTEQQCTCFDARQGIPLKLNLLPKLSLDVFKKSWSSCGIGNSAKIRLIFFFFLGTYSRFAKPSSAGTAFSQLSA